MEKLTAVYDDDLEPFFKSIGVLRGIQEGSILCKFCDEIITFDNFLAAFPLNDQICLCCENEKCLIEINKLKVG